MIQRSGDTGASEAIYQIYNELLHFDVKSSKIVPELVESWRSTGPTTWEVKLKEGVKREPHPKLEVYRGAVGKPLLQPSDNWIVALASDGPVPEARVPVLPLDDIDKIVDVLLIESLPIDRLAEIAEKV